MDRPHATQRQRILDQFTRQAVPFSRVPQHLEPASTALTLDCLAPSPEEEALDVACGPGLLTLALAGRCRHVTGIDVTPAMLERARELQAAQGIGNAVFTCGDAAALPYADGRFPLVVSRYAFHHLLEPARALAEMCRVCAPGGRVAVIDATPPAACRAAYDRLERWRDPSHTSALTVEELEGLGAAAGLVPAAAGAYRLATGAEALLGSSFPVEGGAERFRQRLWAEAEAGIELTGFAPEVRDGELWLSFPVSIRVWHTGGR